MRRRIVLTVILALIAIGAMVVWVLTASIRNQPLQVGSGDEQVIAEQTPETTLESGEIPLKSAPATLAFSSDRDGNWDIVLASPDGTQTNLTADDSGAQDYFPSFSLDGAMINFISSRSITEMGPAQVKPDGTDLRSLSILSAIMTLVSEGRFDWDPAWSPDGGRLLWSSLRDFQLEVYSIPTDAEFVISNAQKETDTSARDWFGSWSPDGTQIVFASDRNGNEDIFTTPIEGTDVTQVTDNSFDDFHGMWSLDGAQIAYVRDEDDTALLSGQLVVRLMNADGTDDRLLEGVWVGDPVVSPDGTQVAYVSNETGKWQVYVMNADGTNKRRITDEGNNLFPVWKP